MNGTNPRHRRASCLVHPQGHALRAIGVAVLASCAVAGSPAQDSARGGRVLHVRLGGTGDGTAGAPLGRIQRALDAAQAGDVVLVAAGVYDEALTTVRAGTADHPIVVRGADAASRPLVTASGRVLTVSHPFLRVERMVLDGQFGPDDAVRVSTAGEATTLSGVEVRRSGRDCIDLASPSGVLIENSLVHRCLNPANGRTDAHGIVAASATRLTIRGTEVHTFSGDAVQLDPSRSAPGWDELDIQGCHFWLEPLARAENGFAAGTIPGENGLDTKTHQSTGRSRARVRDTVMHGFRSPLAGNTAAFNLKEHVDALIDRVTVYDSEIAFRLRGPADTGARVRISNAVIHDVAVGFRYEDGLQGLRVWNVTLGAAVTRPFLRASSPGSLLDVRNLLLLGRGLPSEAPAAHNMAVSGTAFVSASTHDYRLRPGSSPVESGLTDSRRHPGPDGHRAASGRRTRRRGPRVVLPRLPAVSRAPVGASPVGVPASVAARR